MADDPLSKLVTSLLQETQEEEDESGSGTGSGAIEPPPVFFDVHREVAALRDIREVEAREFGHVDASTHSDLEKKKEGHEEGAELMQGPLAHPILEDKAYFSGVDEIRNNPLYSNNTEAELRYKEHQLQYEKKLQLQKNLELSNSKKFNPTPRPS